jgi:hypothetical protein
MSLGDKLDPKPLVQQLIDKTAAGKLNWEPTADRKTFIASLAGKMSFRIQMISVTDVDTFGQPDVVDIPLLEMLDEKGKVLWGIRGAEVPRSTLESLYELARRVGNRLDERLEQALAALSHL